MHSRVRLILATALALAVSACAQPQLFGSCPFDGTIVSNCKTATGSQSTCVVEKHPQCDEDVCLSWKGLASRCTRVCTPTGNECPADASCTAFDDNAKKYFCVQLADLKAGASTTKK